MADHFYNATKLSTEHTTTPKLHLKEDNRNKTSAPYNRPFTMKEVHTAVHSMRNSAPGPDKICPDMIKHLTNSNLRCLQYLFNKIWTQRHLPLAWNEAYIIPIHKPDKNKFQPISYRPISLTNVLCKIMEKMISSRLSQELENSAALDRFQSGFRRHRSTIDNLLRLQQEILDGFAQNELTVCVFFDIEKAFDQINKQAILDNLCNLGFCGNLAHFVLDFLTDRNFRV